jgi:putative ABC transport system permease protein
VWSNLISPGFFATYQTPVVAGRDLTDRDRAGAPRVAVVNDAFAAKFAPGRSPIGLRMTLYPGSPLALGPIEVVGVVGDAVYTSVRSPAPPTFYLPLAQFDHLTKLGIRSIRLSVRSRTDAPFQLTKSVTTAVSTVNPQLGLTFQPLASQVAASLTQERLLAILSAAFGALALLLAGLGLYGVTAYTVAARRIEIGIRMALGASGRQVVRLVLARTAFFVGIGVIAGISMSVAAATFVSALIYGLEPRDPLTLAGAVSLLTIVAAVAAWLPSRRAVGTEPAVVLRES